MDVFPDPGLCLLLSLPTGISCHGWNPTTGNWSSEPGFPLSVAPASTCSRHLIDGSLHHGCSFFGCFQNCLQLSYISRHLSSNPWEVAVATSFLEHQLSHSSPNSIPRGPAKTVLNKEPIKPPPRSNSAFLAGAGRSVWLGLRA